MPDWERLVADRIAGAKLAPEVRREVVAEIAAHLQECHDELLEAGSSNPEQETLAQVRDWDRLGRNIRRAKEDDVNFVRRVAVPGAAAVILALSALKLCVYLLIAPEPCGLGATCIRVTADGPAYLPWLATLPLAAALAAGLARRLGASPLQRLMAATLPALYLAGETLVMTALDGAFFWRIPLYWVIIPAIACALGASPFLGRGGDSSGTRRVATTHP